MKLTEIGITTIPELSGEDWVYVQDTNNRYLISNKGRLLTKHQHCATKERPAIMKPALDANGYLRTMIKKANGKFSTIKMHRLTLQHFKENPNNYPQVNHIDYNRTNNDVDNLEWVSPKMNTQHSIQNMRGGFTSENQPANKPFGTRIWNAKINPQIAKEIRSKHKRRIYTYQMLADEYNLKLSHIKDIMSGRTWSHAI